MDSVLSAATGLSDMLNGVYIIRYKSEKHVLRKAIEIPYLDEENKKHDFVVAGVFETALDFCTEMRKRAQVMIHNAGDVCYATIGVKLKASTLATETGPVMKMNFGQSIDRQKYKRKMRICFARLDRRADEARQRLSFSASASSSCHVR